MATKKSVPAKKAASKKTAAKKIPVKKVPAKKAGAAKAADTLAATWPPSVLAPGALFDANGMAANGERVLVLSFDLKSLSAAQRASIKAFFDKNLQSEAAGGGRTGGNKAPLSNDDNI